MAISRQAAQDADADLAQRLFLRPRPHQWGEPVERPFGPTNWSLGVDKKGQPIPNPAKEPAPDGRLIAPDEGGMTNYRSPSFDPKTGLFIVRNAPSYSLYFTKPADGDYGWAGADYGLWGKATSKRSITRQERSGGAIEVGKGGSGAGCSPPTPAWSSPETTWQT